ncbi:cytochrome c3 family protein [Denitratisoma oestradiolicum]|uniref:Doubled CXXCH motif domain-containing protein n=1 Tax=Denitratisoma oestradiolicum TaxID=311182 RepID=A0A6S6YLY1_9PROT|nr:cytochrome c3 family protein [Denitratisoma oestradiolicum]TWO81517.1 hypothetical protein CBW56_05280 [Denitratisoma oestradiolicum]CAB1368734.1 conserved exported protein of unknown function [Denitratisoma oestradiolicum]
MKRLMGVLAISLGLSVLAPAHAAPNGGAGKGAPVTGSQCLECHETEARTHVYHGDCASCHSDGLNHAKAKEPVAVPAGRPESAQCLSCHESDKRRMHFLIAEHNKAGVKCSDCHGLHTPKVKSLNTAMEKAGKTTALCATCHQDVLARFSMNSHHPVKEGAMTCASCHDPHASKQASLGSRTEQCTKCHQAVRGPHVFEHPPAAEDCTICHDPHGTPNKRMLQAAQPVQCLQCHSLPNRRHGQTGSTSTASASIRAEVVAGAVLRDCTSCHAAMHGSSTDQHLRH